LTLSPLPTVTSVVATPTAAPKPMRLRKTRRVQAGIVIFFSVLRGYQLPNFSLVVICHLALKPLLSTVAVLSQVIFASRGPERAPSEESFFPFNPRKHSHDKYIYCPSCRTRINNPTKLHFKLPKFNLNWIKEKLRNYQQKKQAKTVLDRYFKVQTTNKRDELEDYYLFSLNSWMKGNRPRVTSQQINEFFGKNATGEVFIAEVLRLEKLGVNVK